MTTTRKEALEARNATWVEVLKDYLLREHLHNEPTISNFTYKAREMLSPGTELVPKHVCIEALHQYKVECARRKQQEREAKLKELEDKLVALYEPGVWIYDRRGQRARERTLPRGAELVSLVLDAEDPTGYRNGGIITSKSYKYKYQTDEVSWGTISRDNHTWIFVCANRTVYWPNNTACGYSVESLFHQFDRHANRVARSSIVVRFPLEKALRQVDMPGVL